MIRLRTHLSSPLPRRRMTARRTFREGLKAHHRSRLHREPFLPWQSRFRSRTAYDLSRISKPARAQHHWLSRGRDRVHSYNRLYRLQR